MGLFHADTTVGGDGSDFTDDDNVTTGLFNGGHIIRLVPMFQNIVNIAIFVKNTAASIVSNTGLAQNWATLTTGLVSAIDYSAKAYAIGGTGVTGAIGSAKEWATSLGLVDGTYYGARKYAQDALASANAAAQQANTLTATSTTSTVIGTGSKTFTTQSGEQFIAGQFVTIASQAIPANYMYGQVTSYSTTSLVVNVTAIGGTGTFADWLISLSGLQGVQGNTGAAASVTNGNPTNINGLVKGNGSTLSPVVSGTDIKTVGGLSILGSGDVSVAGDATETSSAVSIALVNTSKKVQSVSMTTSDKSITLPNATTCQKGELFTIKNTGVNQFCIRDFNNKFLCALNPNQVVTISLSNNSTSSGTWVVANNSTNTDLIEFYRNARTISSGFGAGGGDAVQITATQFVIIGSSGANLQAAVLTVNSDNTVVQGSLASLVVAISPSSPYIACAKVSSTQVVVFYGTSATNAYAVILTIAGTSVTFNTPIIAVTGGSTAYPASICVLSSTLILIAYHINGNGSVRTLSLSGTTLTADSNQTSFTGGSAGVFSNHLVPLSSTSAAFINATASYILTSITTTSITVTTVSFGLETNSGNNCLELLSANTVIGSQGYSTPYPDYLTVSTISGSTVTSIMKTLDDVAYSFNSSKNSIAVLNQNKVILGKSSSSSVCLFSINVSDKDVKRTPKPYQIYLDTFEKIITIDANKILLIGLTTSSFFSASVIEIAP
ncbi:MAG: hypothetical protein WBI40_09280 [Methylococcaceae bacterium]